MNGLVEYQKTIFDLPERDARNYRLLRDNFVGHNVVIHLAWDTATENWKSGKVNPDNNLMTYNAYQAALESGVRRIVMASSIHADEFIGWNRDKLLTPDKIPVPTSPYGASKVFMESLGRYYAKKYGLEIVCVRFGGVNKDDVIFPESVEKSYGKVWLSRRDCCALIRICIESEEIPNNFTIMHGISDNKGRLHDISNLLGWRPVDGYSE